MNKVIKVPNCVGVIMDGNRRWAKNKGLATLEGHKVGYEAFKKFVTWAKEAGVKNVVTYAFSIENWNRTPVEVSYLIDLIFQVFLKDADVFIKEKISLKFIGKLSLFSEDIQKMMRDLEKKTAHFTHMHVAIAVSYGGREEIVSAANKCIAEGKTTLTEKDISEHLYDPTLPDPDLVIRTAETRTSGFLPWQSVYSELFFTKTLWPDFSKEEFLEILKEYDTRDRRRGE